MLDNALKRAAVLGAAGKMGSGIALLLLEEISRLEAKTLGQVGSGQYVLTLIDANEAAFPGLRTYLRTQIRRYAERSINQLREWYADNAALVSNQEVIDAFVQGAVDNVRFETTLESAKNSTLIFEAVIEDIDLKTQIFSSLNKVSLPDAYYFTNTSSIPIGVIAEKSGLKGRLIGYHFYNPPAVQKLLEIIPAQDTAPELTQLAEELAKRLGKIVVFSRDVAGFIGNGHFLREIDLALQETAQLEREMPQVNAICLMNQITQELLVRPMGIFQLLDYVGIEVLQKVMKIMNRYLGIHFHSDLIDRMVKGGITGGQHPDGTQKPGFFSYEGHAMKQVYSLEKKAYVDLPGNLLGTLPKGHLPWKALSKQKGKEKVLQAYFEQLFQMETPQARLAQQHLVKSRDLARRLVKDGVAHRIEDINTVIMNGFYHLYGPDNAYIPEEAVR